MAIALRQSTASQEVLVGKFVDSTDGSTAETGLTIANTDLKLWKNGATTQANKNSGGATHIANGWYYAVLDATDTNTIGPLVLTVDVAGALSVRVECEVLHANVFDVLFGSVAPSTHTAAAVQALVAAGAVASVTAPVTVTGTPAVNVTQISGDATAADNAEAFFDGTGYAGTNNVIPTVTALTGHTPQTGDAFARIGAPAGASIAADLLAMRGATFDTATDSLEALRNRGDAAWITATGFSTLDASGVRSAVGLASADLDTQLAALPTAGENADAVWDEAQAGHVTVGTFGLYLDSAVSGVSTGGVSAADIADAVWDEARSGHVTTGTFGEYVNANTTHWAGTAIGDSDGTAQGGGSDHIDLASTASSEDDIYNGRTVTVVENTGAGQSRMIRVAPGSYVGSSRRAYVTPPWEINPDSTSKYILGESATANVGQWAGETVSDSDGTAQGGTSNSITLDAADTHATNTLRGRSITIVGGTGKGQSVVIDSNDGTTKEAPIRGTWTTTPDDDSKYIFGEVVADAWAPFLLDVADVEAIAPEHSLAYVILAMTEFDTTTTPDTLTVFRTDGTTVFATKTITAAAGGDVITAIT